MSDLIRRQDAINAVKTYWEIVVDTIPKDMDFVRSFNFCPNCGADMRDKEGAQE